MWSAPEASRKHLSLLCPGPGLSLSVSLDLLISTSFCFFLLFFFPSSFSFLFLSSLHPLPPSVSPWFTRFPHGPGPAGPSGKLLPQQRELDPQGPWDRGAGWGRTPGAPTMQEAAPETQTNPGVPDPRPGSARPPTLSLPGTFPRFLSGKAISALPPRVFWAPEERPLGPAPPLARSLRPHPPVWPHPCPDWPPQTSPPWHPRLPLAPAAPLWLPSAPQDMGSTLTEPRCPSPALCHPLTPHTHTPGPAITQPPTPFTSPHVFPQQYKASPHSW